MSDPLGIFHVGFRLPLDENGDICMPNTIDLPFSPEDVRNGTVAPTIEELRAKMVEEVTALCIVADTYGVRSESMAEAVYRLYDCNRTLQSKERDLG